jgi:hypothetical protein
MRGLAAAALACLLMVAGGALLLAWWPAGQRRDATEAEVRAAAAKCGAIITTVNHLQNETGEGPTNRELGIPNIAVTIDIGSKAEFATKANCIDRELWAQHAYSNIWGPNGEDLLVSSGVDRIT